MSREAQTRYGYRLDPSGLGWSYEPMATGPERRERVPRSPRREPVQLLSRHLERAARWIQDITGASIGKKLQTPELT